jgi:hypothetical protein
MIISVDYTACCLLFPFGVILFLSRSTSGNSTHETGVQIRHKQKGNILVFNPEKLRKIDKSYDLETNSEPTNKQNNFPKIIEEIYDNNSINASTKNEKLLGIAIKPSEPSEPAGSNSFPNTSKDFAKLTQSIVQSIQITLHVKPVK